MKNNEGANKERTCRDNENQAKQVRDGHAQVGSYPQSDKRHDGINKLPNATL
jgi:hypothetical protein